MARKGKREEILVQEEKPQAQTGNDIDFHLETIAELRKERDEYYDQLLRSRADFDNFRKRVKKERAEIRASSRAEVLEQLLPIIDSCEKALRGFPDEPEGDQFEAYRQGFELLLMNLQAVLERYEVTELPGEGSQFDPKVHEAVVRELVEGGPDGQIVEEFRKGYRMGDRLLRPSHVRVAVKVEPKSPEE